MRLKPQGFLIVCFFVAQTFVMPAFSRQNSGPMTNADVIELRKAGVGDEVIIAKIQSGPVNFTMATADIVALKSAGISDSIVAEMLKTLISNAPRAGSLDLSDGALILPFSSAIQDPAAANLPDLTRTAVLNILKGGRLFPAVGTPEEAMKDRPAKIEINAELVDFAGGNVAKRILVGVGTGRAHAGFSFTVKETATGKILWKKTIKETASFWSNSASSSSQRLELPEKVAKSFVEQITKAKIVAQSH